MCSNFPQEVFRVFGGVSTSYFIKFKRFAAVVGPESPRFRYFQKGCSWVALIQRNKSFFFLRQSVRGVYFEMTTFISNSLIPLKSQGFSQPWPKFALMHQRGNKPSFSKRVEIHWKNELQLCSECLTSRLQKPQNEKQNSCRVVRFFKSLLFTCRLFSFGFLAFAASALSILKFESADKKSVSKEFACTKGSRGVTSLI